MAALRLVALAFLAASVASAFVVPPNEKKHDHVSFTSIMAKDGSRLRNTRVLCEDDHDNSLYRIKSVLSSTTASLQIRGDTNVSQVVQILKEQPPTILSIQYKREAAPIASTPRTLRALIRINDDKGNEETLAYRVPAGLALIDTEASGMGAIPAFALPLYSELPSWAKNQQALSVSFTVHVAHRRGSKKMPPVLSTSCILSTINK